MRTLFVDTYFWIALTNPRDEGHMRAVEIKQDLERLVRLVTTEDVLIEFLSFFSSSGSQMRLIAAKIVRALYQAPDVEIVPQTSRIFQSGLDFYEARADKSYSMVDGMSMRIMKQYGLTDVLTKDQHFAQEGFSPLF